MINAENYGIFKVECYEQDKYFGWTITACDNILATCEDEALEKFHIKHPDIKVATVVNYVYADY